jgi:hypothetical protein
MKSCTCYALRAVDCTCLPAKYDEIYEIYTTPEQEPVAWLHTKIEGVAVPHRPADLDKHPDRWEALYKTPPSCPTCKALSRTVMLDQTSHDTTPPAAPVQEPKQSEIFCGVDFAEGVLSVSVLRRSPDDVAELLHFEQIELQPPAAQKPWVGLTDEERNDLLDTYITAEGRARAIEHKLKEKNT